MGRRGASNAARMRRESGERKRQRSDTRTLVVQFVAESRFANCEFANLFFDFDGLQFS